MTKTRLSFWGLLAVCLLLSLWLAGPAGSRTVSERGSSSRGLDEADPNAQRDLIAHDIGNVRLTLANWGELGNPDGTPGFKGFEYPLNSGSDFLFSAGVWVGAIVNGVRLVSTTTDGDNGTNEFWPVHIGSFPEARALRDPDWHVTSKNFDTFSGQAYVWGAKGLDDDGDWNPDTDDLDGDGKPSSNWDGGIGLIGVDDDCDGLIDEEIANGLDDDGDGRVDEDTDVTSDANGDGNCAYDPEPHVDEDPAGDMSNDGIDNDFDGLVDLDDPDYDGDCCPGLLDDDGDGLFDEDGVARGVQEYFCMFHDDISGTYVGSPDNDGHTPLRIQMLQRTYAFPEAYASSFILIDYRIRNVGFTALNNVYAAMFSDPDIGAAGEGGDAASLDDMNYFLPGVGCPVRRPPMMIQWDIDGPPGVFAIAILKTPAPLESLRVSFRNFERVSGGDPETNVDKYNMITSGTIDPPTAQQGDWRMLMGFGDARGGRSGFELAPGQELPITVAFVAGPDTAACIENAIWALRMYLNDFQGPSAPDAPEFYLDVYPGENAVRIRWTDNAEGSVDPITREEDFEGYIIERSTDQLTWQTIQAYDRIDTLEYPFELENYNQGMPTDVLWQVDSTFEDGAWVVDSTKFYYYWDRDLIPGHVYYYSVRAYDQGVIGAGILYSGRTGNVREALMARTTDTDPRAPTSLDGVYVFPNPYKGSHDGESGGQVNPTKGLIEYPRKLYFRGLPAEHCTIRIYSLAGDHVATVNHTNGTEQDQWDMITRNRQEIVSGIYYYVVEYGSQHFIDKFVVIK